MCSREPLHTCTRPYPRSTWTTALASPSLRVSPVLIHTSPAQSFLWGTCFVTLYSESSGLLLPPASKVHTGFPTRHVYTQPLSTHQLHAQAPSTCQVHAQPPSTCKALWPCPACSCLLSMLAPPSTPTPTSATCVCTRDRGLAKRACFRGVQAEVGQVSGQRLLWLGRSRLCVTELRVLQAQLCLLLHSFLWSQLQPWCWQRRAGPMASRLRAGATGCQPFPITTRVAM